MKPLLLILTIFAFCACNNHERQSKKYLRLIENQQKEIQNLYDNDDFADAVTHSLKDNEKKSVYAGVGNNDVIYSENYIAYLKTHYMKNAAELLEEANRHYIEKAKLKDKFLHEVVKVKDKRKMTELINEFKEVLRPRLDSGWK